MARTPKRRIDRATRLTGRKRRDTTPFAMLPDDMLKSAASRTLPHPARTVLTVLAAQYVGHRNGSLTLTHSTARKYGIADPHMLHDSLRELEARGLILRTRPGSRIPPLSAMYGLCWRPIDDPLEYDPHHAKATLTAPDEWRTWSADMERPHWTITRRAARWGRTTQPSGDAPLINPQMSGDAPLKQHKTRVGRPTSSDIRGRGAVAVEGAVRGRTQAFRAGAPEKTKTGQAKKPKNGAELVFMDGVNLLVASGKSEPHARAFFRKRCTDWGESRVVDAVRLAVELNPENPADWIRARLKGGCA